MLVAMLEVAIKRRPFIVVAAASSSGKDADPNEAFIPPQNEPKKT